MSTSVELEALASAAFTEQFGSQPTVLGCAPGRVELLGNHTDYNGGLVMAAAIDRVHRCCWTSLARQVLPRSRRQLPRHRLVRPRHIGTWRDRRLGRLCEGRGLGNSRCCRSATLFGVRAGDCGQCSPGCRSVEFG